MTELDQVAELLRHETGIWIHDDQLPSLEAALRYVAPSTTAPEALAACLQAPDGVLLGRLIDALTVKETFFFRQCEEFDAIDWPALLELAHRSGSERVRVWVAACATGEEAYTLAVLASDAFRTVTPPVWILGTDISAAAIVQARTGRYGRRAVRAIDEDTRERHFRPDADGVVVGAGLRAIVSFRLHNLARDHSPAPQGGSFELIACRNVLIYFDAQAVERTVALLESALTPDGKLMIGAADRLCVSARHLGQIEHGLAADRRPSRTPARSGNPPRQPLGLGGVHPIADVAPTRAPAPALSADGLDAALAAANTGDLKRAVAMTSEMLHHDPLDSDAHFVRGLAELGLGAPAAAVSSFRRALFVDGGFGLAAFQLGRAHEANGDDAAAGRAYERALRVLATSLSDESRHAAIHDQVDVGDVAAACRIRLRELTPGRGRPAFRAEVAGGRS